MSKHEGEVVRLDSIALLPFSHNDRCALEASMRSTGLASMSTVKHMAERHVPIAGQVGERLWLFYLPDFTRLFKDWYESYIKSLMRLYGLTGTAHLAVEPTFVVLKYEGVRPRDIVYNALTMSNYGWVEGLLADAALAESACIAGLSSLARGVRNGDASLLPHVLTLLDRFAAFGLNDVFPEALVRARFPSLAAGSLFYSPISSWGILHDTALEHLLSVYCGEMEKVEAASRYALETSYVRWGDIESCEEDIRYAHLMINGFRAVFRDARDIWQYQEERRVKRRISGSPSVRHAQFVRSARSAVAASDRVLFDVVSGFATAAQRYNEMRRLLFTKALRLVRDICESRCLEWRTVPLTTVLHQAHNQTLTKGGEHDA